MIFAVLFAVFDYASYTGPFRGYIHKLTCLDGGRFGYDEVAPVLLDIGDPDQSTELILGDSVANQMFAGILDNDPNVKICPINRAITLAGQYILIEEYLKGHPDATDVYIAVYSGTLASTVDSDLSYQYIAMPFIINGYSDGLDDLVMGKLTKMFGSFFLKPGVLDYINNSGVNRTIYFNAVSSLNKIRYPEEEYPAVSDISIDYLQKIYSLCKEHGAEVHLISTPLCDIPERHAECQKIRETFDSTILGEMYPDYCDSFFFADENMFLDDQVHFKDEYKNRKTFDPMLERMFN